MVDIKQDFRVPRLNSTAVEGIGVAILVSFLCGGVRIRILHATGFSQGRGPHNMERVDKESAGGSSKH
jgi:hypothetical protein